MFQSAVNSNWYGIPAIALKLIANWVNTKNWILNHYITSIKVIEVAFTEWKSIKNKVLLFSLMNYVFNSWKLL